MSNIVDQAIDSFMQFCGKAQKRRLLLISPGTAGQPENSLGSYYAHSSICGSSESGIV
jgi:hypothetical protein